MTWNPEKGQTPTRSVPAFAVPPAFAARNALFLVVLAFFVTGCATTEKHKYGPFGPVVGEEVEIFEDYWTDSGPFRPDDPSLPLRRGKAGVLRFFKKDNYLRSVRVDGSIIVYVFQGTQEGVELTKPKAQLVLSPEELEKHRKYDKKIGHSYHLWLDLGLADQPEEEISILTIFTDAKTKEQTSSQLIRTTAPGSPNPSVEQHDPVIENTRLKNEKKYQPTVFSASEPGRPAAAESGPQAPMPRTLATIDLASVAPDPLRSASGAQGDESFEEEYKRQARENILNRYRYETASEDTVNEAASKDAANTRAVNRGTINQNPVHKDAATGEALLPTPTNSKLQADFQHGQYLIPSTGPVPVPANDLLKGADPSKSVYDQ